jgi:hypothetical protein
MKSHGDIIIASRAEGMQVRDYEKLRPRIYYMWRGGNATTWAIKENGVMTL